MKTKRKKIATTALDSEDKIYDCAIIGGGPGGLLSALYLARFRRSVVIVNAGKPRAFWIPKIHNLVGVDHPLSGKILLKKTRAQLHDLGTQFIQGEAKVERSGELFLVKVDQEILRARKIIFATGVEDVSPSFPNLIELRKKERAPRLLPDLRWLRTLWLTDCSFSR